MTEHVFDEALLSGYIDGELTQRDQQRVRLHLDDCAVCKTTFDELTSLREATMNSSFQVPDTQWDEAPRGVTSRLLHNSGWLLAGLWVAGLIGYLVWQAASDSISLRFEAFLGFGLLLAFGLVLGSALVDRLKTRKNDPYRKVEK